MSRAAQKIETPPKVDLTRLAGGGRAPGRIVRDLSKNRSDADSGVPLWRASASGRAWLVAILLKAFALLVVLLALVLGPPALECRHRAETGFFAGDTLLGCIGGATNQRLRDLENQINRLVRGSGA
jgi:hypothetical protein